MQNQIATAVVDSILSVLANFWWLPFVLLFLAFLKSSLFKGWFGEKAVQSRLRGLDEAVYRPFHDLIVPSRRGTTQIDHVYVSRFGIFVIETKNYSGWIYGSENQAKWTQVVYRQKNSFQNPLRQNDAHIKALAVLLGLPESSFHSIVIFLGGCEFKTEMPDNVCYIGKAKRYIHGFQTDILNEVEINRICTILQRKEYTADRKSRVKHKNHLRQQHQSN